MSSKQGPRAAGMRKSANAARSRHDKAMKTKMLTETAA